MEYEKKDICRLALIQAQALVRVREAIDGYKEFEDIQTIISGLEDMFWKLSIANKE